MILAKANALILAQYSLTTREIGKANENSKNIRRIWMERKTSHASSNKAHLVSAEDMVNRR